MSYQDLLMEDHFKHFVVLQSTSDTCTHTHILMSLYLFDCQQQPAIAVDHHQDGYTQAENEEADDVGV